MTAKDAYRIDEEASNKTNKLLIKKWGKEKFEKMLQKGLTLDLTTIRTLGAVTYSGYLTYWLTKHFEQEYEKYKPQAIPMTPAMLTPRYKAWRESIFRKVEKVLRLNS